MRKKFFFTVTCNVVLCNFSFLYALSSKLSSYFFLPKSHFPYSLLAIYSVFVWGFFSPIRYGLQTHNSGCPLNSSWLISLNLKNLTQDWIWYSLRGQINAKSRTITLTTRHIPWEHMKATPAYFRSATHLGLHLINNHTKPQAQVGRVSKNQCLKSQVLFFFFCYPIITWTSGNLICSVLRLDSSRVPGNRLLMIHYILKTSLGLDYFVHSIKLMIL